MDLFNLVGSASSRLAMAAVALLWLTAAATTADFAEPWARDDRALVVDAYEYNEIDWSALAGDKKIAGFIGKASDGLPPAYRCDGDADQMAMCRLNWKRYSLSKELFRTRRTMAKSLGLEWGAYHLGRPGNPVEQADHFIRFANPAPDDLVALDIEGNDPSKWMSLEDAERFAQEIKRRLGRFPVLYTNGSTAAYIADHSELYPLLSRLPLWYARYTSEIGDHFPAGNWRNYALWQFASQTNCNDSACPYRVPGTGNDIDVSVAAMDTDQLRAAWPFDAPLDVTDTMIADAAQKRDELASADQPGPDGNADPHVPIPFPRVLALLLTHDDATTALGYAGLHTTIVERASDAFSALVGGSEHPTQREIEAAMARLPVASKGSEETSDEAARVQATVD